MPFKKYASGNPSGKPLGAKNKTTIEIKEFIVHFISYNIDSIQTNFNELEPKEKLLFIEKLLKYVLPQNFEIETPKEETIITIEG